LNLKLDINNKTPETSHELDSISVSPIPKYQNKDMEFIKDFPFSEKIGAISERKSFREGKITSSVGGLRTDPKYSIKAISGRVKLMKR
jgi:hypothetical protein